MKYLKTEEGFHYLFANDWVSKQLKEWLDTEMLKYVDYFDKKIIEYLDSSNGEIGKYDYKYISSHAYNNPGFIQTSIYINSLLRLPWNIFFTINTYKGKSNPALKFSGQKTVYTGRLQLQ